MILAKKVRLKPTMEQEQQLWKSVGTARFIYNWTLNRQQENERNGGKFILDGVLRKELTQLKQTEALSWLNDVSNNVAKQAVKDACNSFKKFFKGESAYPKFKSRRKSKLSFYNDNVKLKIKKKFVLLEKIGWVQTAEQLPTGCVYVNPRVSFYGKYWYLAIGIEQTFPQEELTDVSLGIDVGINKLAYCSNGESYQNINKTKAVKKIEKRLHKLQRSVSRKYEMNKEGNRFVKTSNIIKIEKDIRKLHRRVANIRHNHLHQTTSAIVKTKPYRIVMETLNIKGMMRNQHLAKAIQKQGLYEFKKQIQYKCEKYGIAFIEADQWYPSSKMCVSCGNIKRNLKLADRMYHCEMCGHVQDRDLNASINLARYNLAK
ncbi:RNA-guided endonuclease InsQ/TnpB family protein [Providencia sp. NPDC089923]|uniref:RNA-guided endonuclease InsQ/TnpB family protein n=1 Tax=Providencia sp. NPDC089923 TaxID=3415004 RepID=UPI003C2FF2ED